VHGLPISSADIFWPMLYGLGYASVLLFMAIAVFQKRDMK
jgi:hypothetical protein